jgi:hypothetical protein
LVPLHRFLIVDASLISTFSDQDVIIPIEIMTGRSIIEKLNVLETVTDERKPLIVQFSAGSNLSYPFEIARFPIINFDSIKLKVTFSANFSVVSGFAFQWTYSRPDFEKYWNLAKVVLCFPIACMFSVFLTDLTFGTDFCTKLFLILLGCSGLLSGNPVNIFYPEPMAPRLFDHIAFACFIALFRMSLMVQLEILRVRKNIPHLSFLVMFALFFAAASVFDTNAGYDRHCCIFAAKDLSTVSLRSESLRLGFDAVYLALSLAWVAAAATKSENVRRLWFFGGSAALTGAATVVVRGVFVVMDWWTCSRVPQIAFASVHVAIAAVTLFLMHSDQGPEYKEFDKNVREEKGDVELGIEEVSEEDMQGVEEEEGDPSE